MHSKIDFAIGLHFHQPVGNFDEILDRAYSNCYKAFLDVCSKYPEIKMTFHFSGNLLDYLEDAHPEFIDRIKEMVAGGQVEIMGGGYYEPILQAIPRRDRIGQIEMLSDYSKKRFAVKPNGLWVPERVWSPELIEDFCACGMRYCILDDTHLIRAGIRKKDMLGYFLAGDDKRSIAVFPTDKNLRYMIPFKAPRETTDYFKRESGNKKGALFTYGDDGEKFGEWPWTYEWVYKKGWLDNFFKTLRDNREWLNTVMFSEYLDSHLPLGHIFIPEASYEEMMEWSGGSWMNFLSKYHESNQMHKRMMYTSERINEIEIRNPKSEIRKKIEEAKKELYKGQTNCAYWHGVFGGIYLYHLRNAVYEHLIRADRIIDELEHRGEDAWTDIKEIDFYIRSEPAVILEDRNFFICIDPSIGGMMRELDYKKRSVNLINTLTRRREAYHEKIVAKIKNEIDDSFNIHEVIKAMDPRIKTRLFYDRFARSCLIDHFIKKELKREQFADCDYKDMGDFSEAPYLLKRDERRIVLTRRGEVEGRPVQVMKEIGISSDREIEISYTLLNNSDSKLDTYFGTEFNITMPHGDPKRYRYGQITERKDGLDRSGAVSGADCFSIADTNGDFEVRLIFSVRPENIWYFPVYTVSQSERAYNADYQSSCIFPIWNIMLESEEEMRFGIKWRMA